MSVDVIYVRSRVHVLYYHLLSKAVIVLYMSQEIGGLMRITVTVFVR